MKRGAIVVLILGSIFVCDYIVNGAQAAKRQQAIEAELRSIPLAPDARETGYYSFHKTHNGSASLSVSVRLSADALRA